MTAHDGPGTRPPAAGEAEAYVAELRAVGVAAGLEALGVADAEPFADTRRILHERKAAGLADRMAFTYRNPERSTEPDRIVAGARSILVGSLRYRPPNDGPGPGAGAAPAGPMGRVAAYATADHYARLRSALEEVAGRLRDDGAIARVVADDNALVDRAAAHRAGLGWFGKSSNLLAPDRGSWFVLGSVVTDRALVPDQPVADGCGTCSRCITGCPTGAIVAPGVVDARRCLAWLVQAEGTFPLEFREALGDRLYGCDECQVVCPPNRRDVPVAFAPAGNQEFVAVLELLDATDDELLDRYGRWYIPRRDPRYLRRNALVVLGNVGSGSDARTAEALTRYLDGDDALLAEHAVWAARRLGRGDLVGAGR